MLSAYKVGVYEDKPVLARYFPGLPFYVGNLLGLRLRVETMAGLQCHVIKIKIETIQ